MTTQKQMHGLEFVTADEAEKWFGTMQVNAIRVTDDWADPSSVIEQGVSITAKNHIGNRMTPGWTEYETETDPIWIVWFCDDVGDGSDDGIALVTADNGDRVTLRLREVERKTIEIDQQEWIAVRYEADIYEVAP